VTTSTAPTVEDLSAQLDALYGSGPTPQHVLDAALDVFAEHFRALTVRQSWAGLIAAVEELGDEAKGTENRTWLAHRRGPILIHSAAKKDDGSRAVPAWAEPLIKRVPKRLQARGRVLAVATLADCHESEPGCCPSLWAERDAGVYHWQLTDVRALPEPIPAKGTLGLWKPGRDVVAQVLEQLTEVSDA
jgi:hypothetical protein